MMMQVLSCWQHQVSLMLQYLRWQEGCLLDLAESATLLLWMSQQKTHSGKIMQVAHKPFTFISQTPTFDTIPYVFIFFTEHNRFCSYQRD